MGTPERGEGWDGMGRVKWDAGGTGTRTPGPTCSRCASPVATGTGAGWGGTALAPPRDRGAGIGMGMGIGASLGKPLPSPASPARERDLVCPPQSHKASPKVRIYHLKLNIASLMIRQRSFGTRDNRGEYRRF